MGDLWLLLFKLSEAQGICAWRLTQQWAPGLKAPHPYRKDHIPKAICCCLVAKSCLALCVCVCVCVCVLCLTLLQPHGCSLAMFLCLWDFPCKNTGVDCHSLLQGIFLTQGTNPGLLHCRQILYHPNHQGSPPKISYSVVSDSLWPLGL